MYDLSQSKFLHKRDLRCLDYHAGTLVTRGSLNLFTMHPPHARPPGHLTRPGFLIEAHGVSPFNRRGG